jgi:8-oxo-dGTP pyrophosphatase MutT (NUDIX family)
MKISAGTLIKYGNKFLFCHPTNSSWVGTFGPAKGGVDEGESLLEAAIRETMEEIGITITEEMISNVNNPIEVLYYKNKKKNVIHKKVYLFAVEIKALSEIGLETELVPKDQLQTAEVDWAGFLTKEEMLDKCFHRFRFLIDTLV